MNILVRWGTALALLPIAACAGNPPPRFAAAPPAPPPLSAQDQSFIATAAEGGMDEVQEGDLAAKQAGRPAIRRFGQKMVDDHSQINQQLMAIAAADGVTPPQLTDADQATLTRLQGLHGRRFDMVYLRDQVADHQKMVALLQQEISQGSDPRLKAFAQATLPVIEQHLAMAQDIAGIRHPRGPAA